MLSRHDLVFKRPGVDFSEFTAEYGSGRLLVVILQLSCVETSTGASACSR